MLRMRDYDHELGCACECEMSCMSVNNNKCHGLGYPPWHRIICCKLVIICILGNARSYILYLWREDKGMREGSRSRGETQRWLNPTLVILQRNVVDSESASVA
jgi:hypothetical protein